jgi:UPF0271 protein
VVAKIDLNSDLGESFGAWRSGDDAAMFGVVSSANVACGFHAGDPLTMRESVALAVRYDVILGAHPGYRDLAGFGRRALDVTPDEIGAELIVQLGGLDAAARVAGARVRYVKAHGALYHRLGADPAAAVAFADAAAAYDPELWLLGGGGSALAAAADAAGLRFATEGFADRSIGADGRLIPRGEPGAVLTEPAAVAARAVELARSGRVDSICLHGDTPGAAALARAVRSALERDGIEIRPFA